MISLMDIIISLSNMGVMDVLIPFLLIFSVMFAIISNMKILGDNRKIHMFMSIAFACMVVIPHITGTYPPGKDVVVIMNNAVPNVSGVLIAAIMFLILIGVFGISFDPTKEGGAGIVTLLAMGIVFIIFGNSAGWFDLGLPPWLGFLNDPDVLSLIVTVLVFVIIIAMVTAKERGTNDPDTALWRFIKGFGSGFTPPPRT
jgi:hypothetical protein